MIWIGKGGENLEKRIIVGLMAMMVILAVVMFSGCVDTQPKEIYLKIGESSIVNGVEYTVLSVEKMSFSEFCEKYEEKVDIEGGQLYHNKELDYDLYGSRPIIVADLKIKKVVEPGYHREAYFKGFKLYNLKEEDPSYGYKVDLGYLCPPPYPPSKPIVSGESMSVKHAWAIMDYVKDEDLSIRYHYDSDEENVMLIWNVT